MVKVVPAAAGLEQRPLYSPGYFRDVFCLHISFLLSTSSLGFFFFLHSLSLWFLGFCVSCWYPLSCMISWPFGCSFDPPFSVWVWLLVCLEFWLTISRVPLLLSLVFCGTFWSLWSLFSIALLATLCLGYLCVPYFWIFLPFDSSLLAIYLCYPESSMKDSGFLGPN